MNSNEVGFRPAGGPRHSSRRRAADVGGIRFSRPFRSLAGTLVIAVAAVGLSLVPATTATAAVVQWGTNSGTAPNYVANVNGDFLMAGNGVLACATATVQNIGTCNDLHAASGGNTNTANDNFRMDNSNTVSGFTTNSSSATLTIPAGAAVSKAYLTWSANTGSFNLNQTSCAAPSAARGTPTLPSGAANGYLSRAPQLRVGTGAIGSVAPQLVLVDPGQANQPQYYSGSADVTAAFAGAATGSPLTVSAGNIWTPTGAGCYAGWSITVVYDYGTFIPGNLNSVPKRIIYYEGHVRQASTDDPLTVAFNGFTAVDSGTRAGFTLFEGDRVIAGDTAEYNRNGSATYTQIPNAAGAPGNFGIGRGAGSLRYTQTGNTSAFTNQSVDVTTAPLPNVVSGDSTVGLRIDTSGDSYLLRNAILSVPTAGLVISKSFTDTVDSQGRIAGEAAAFRITLTNTGAGTLRNIVVTDDIPSTCARDLGALTLAPLASTSYDCVATNGTTATYSTTATATARTVNGDFLAEDADATLVQLSAIALAKTSALAPGAIGRAGDVVTYTFTATNTGQQTLTNVAIADPLAGLSALSYTWPGPAGTLTAGQVVTATARYTLTQNDVNAGAVVNTASASATDGDGGAQPTATAGRTTTVAAAPALTISKQGALAPGATGAVGDRVNYTFTFTNTGNVTLTNVSLVDPLPGLSPPVITWPTAAAAGTLQPGQTATATAFLTLQQSNVNTGSVSNAATVSGRTPGGATTSTNSNTVVVPTIASSPALVTTKSASVAGGGTVGSVITYSFSARNSGNVTLTGVAIADPLPGLSALAYTWPGTAGTLQPGQTVTATATYTITQADVDARSVRNTATATGTAPSGASVSAAAPAVTTPTAASAPAVTLTKSGTAAGSTAGSVVTYSFVLRNTGNVTLTGAGITDPLPGLSAITYGTWPGGTVGRLAPGEQITATATYTLTQADVDAGAVVNTATGSGAPPTGAAVTQQRSATVPIAPTGALVVTKSGTPGGGAAGSTITYSFTVRNSGNVTLTQVRLTDPLPGLSTPVVTWPGTPGTLAPGQTASATATYTVRQSDVDSGAVRNTASATGRTPAGASVSAASPQSVVATAAAAPALTTAKSSVVLGGAAGNAGDVIRYTITASNTGNTTLTGVGIADPLPGLSALSYTWPGTPGTLAPGQTVTAIASYTIRQADVNTGSVVNTATASALFGTTPVSDDSGAITTPTAAAAPAVVVTKSGALAAGQPAAAGSTVTWSLTLRNAGNVTLTSASISDSLAGISPVTYGTWPSGTPGTLQPGQTVTATATSTLTQADVDAGSISNIATGRGTSPGGAVVESTAPATVPLAAAPALVLEKSAAVGGSAGVGSTVTYTFVARNAGTVTLDQVAIADPLPGISAVSYGTWPSGTTGRLLPGQQVTATAIYTLTQADVDAGVVRNTATATATPPAGPVITARSPQVSVTTAAAAPALVTTKSAIGGGGGVGSTVTYSFSARNAGNVTLTSVAIADPLPGLTALSYTWPGTAGTLAPGQTATATATYVLTQADVNAGAVTNRATASGTPPVGAPITAQSAQVVTATAAAAPALVTTKSGSLIGAPVAGSTVDYSFSTRNAGNVTLTGVVIADPLPGLTALTYTWPGTPGTLQPGQAVTATAQYTVRQADVDAGAVANTATASGTPPVGAAVTAAASATVPLAAAAAITVAKSGVVAAPGGVGSTVTWSFSIRNAGNVTLSAIVLEDSLAGLSAPVFSWPGAARVLAPGQVATATATSTLTQADLDRGTVTNTATVRGTPPAGPAVAGVSEAATVTTAAAAPALEVVKAASRGGAGAVGDLISYDFTLTNTGNQTVTGIALTDALVGLSTPSITWPGASGVLAPGQSATATATYVIRQSDVDAGSVTNEARIAGTAPGGVAVSDLSGAVVTPTAAAAPVLAVTKTGAFAAGSTFRAGDTVAFTVTLRNAGNVTLSGVSAADPLVGISPFVYGWPGADGVLRPGQTATATASYTALQSDIDAGSIANTATGTATAAGGGVTGTGSATVPVPASALLSLAKTASIAGPGAVGDVVTYTFTARNTGAQTLTGVAIADPLAGLSALDYTWPGTAGTLAPNQQVTATATRTITQTDVDAGVIPNTATVSGTTPQGATASAQAAATVRPVAAAPRIETEKSAVVAAPGGVGSLVTYTLSARNTGNVTLTGVAIADPLPGLSALQYAWPGSAGVLAPGAVVTATATATITQADVDAGRILNTATATGTPPTGPAVTDASPQLVTPTQAADARIAVTKQGELVGPAAVDSVIEYGFTITNTGNVTLTGTTLTDSLAGISAVSFGTWPSGTTGTLRPGDTVTATAEYTVRQSDVDAGSVANAGTASGTPPLGARTTATAPATVPLGATGTVAFDKSASVGGAGALGDLVTYTFTAVNTGNVTLSNVVIADPLENLSALAYTWPGTPGVLAPGQSVTATATYAIRQRDLNAGSVLNTATLTARTPAGVTVTASDAATAPTAAAAPSIATTKTVSTPTGVEVGDSITYTLRATNTGNVTLTGVTIADPLPGLSTPVYGAWPDTEIGRLRPGQSVTAIANYTIRQSDVDAGAIQNTATSSGLPPVGGAVTGSATRTTPTVEAAPAIQLDQTGAIAAGAEPVPGTLVTWSFTVRNAGNTTLSTVEILPELSGISALTYSWPGAPGVLAPGQQATATATSPLTQAQIDAGIVEDPATVTGVSTIGGTVSDDALAEVTIPQTAEVRVSKSGALADPEQGGLGDSVLFSFAIENRGNVTLFEVELTDPLVGLTTPVITWPGAVGELAPGATATATASYVLTQDNVDAGEVLNTATVDAVDPADEPITAESDQVVVTTGDERPALLTTKSAVGAGGGVGDTITYELSAQNVGNVTLEDVEIIDPIVGPLVYTWPGIDGVLAVGETATATASYVLTQADIDRGVVVNTARSEGTTLLGTETISPQVEVRTPTEAASPGLSLDKAVTLADGSEPIAGGVLDYTFTVRNDGNVTLSGVAVADALPGLSAIDAGGFDGSLVPGESTTFTAIYTITQSDVDAGGIANSATAGGAPLVGGPVTATDPASFPIAPEPGITLSKAAVVGGAGAVGDEIAYSFSATNTGTVTLSVESIADPLPGLSALDYDWPGTPGLLAPGQTVTATAVYEIQQSDIDRGVVRNSASVVARTPAGEDLFELAPQVVTAVAPAEPELTVDKSAVVDGPGALGDVVTYTLLVTNTGTATVEGVTVADTLPGLGALVYGAWPDPENAGTLAPGQTVTATAQYTITQADLDAEQIENTATASGAAAISGDPVGSAPDSVTTPTAAAEPAISIVDSGALAGGATGVAGDEVVWTYVITNEGTVTLDGVAVADAIPIAGLAYDWPGAPGVLAPGQSVTATARAVLTQDQVDAGVITSTATATGLSPQGTEVDATGTADVLIAARGALATVKTGALAPGASGALGDVVQYRLEITNVGNVTLTEGTLLDPLPGIGALTIVWPDPDRPGRVGVGETVVGTAPYALQQADIDRGYIDNQADVGARTPAGVLVTAPSNTVRVTTAQPQPELTTTKTAEVGGEGAVGDVITYTIRAENTGTVTLTGVTLADPLPGLGGLGDYAWPDVDGVLAPGDAVTATAEYVITQDDVDAGAVVNTATATGDSPDGLVPSVRVSDDSAAVRTPTAAASPSILVENSGQLIGAPALDGEVRWTYELTNTGNVTLSGVTLADALPGTGAPAYVWPNPLEPGVLPPGQSVVATSTYLLTQADVDAGSVTSLVTGTGTPPIGADVTAGAPATVPIAADGRIQITKVGVTPDGASVGDRIEYTITITNPGTVTLSSIVLKDDLPGVSNAVVVWPGLERVLAPGESATATAFYTITQADVDRGYVDNEAFADGITPTGGDVTGSSGVVRVPTDDAAPAIATSKTAVLDGEGAVGNVVTYSFIAENTGTVTLTGATLTDSLPGLSAITLNWPQAEGVLAPGESVTGRATYVITQADVDRGSIVNTASASGQPPVGDRVADDSETVTTPTIAAVRTISVTDSGALAAGAVGRAGDLVTFTYTVTNTGTVTASGVRVDEATPGISTPEYLWPGEPGVLLPGQTVTATATVVLTQADVDAGSITSVIAGFATHAGGVEQSQPASATVPITSVGILDTVKTGEYRTGNGQVGDVIEYRLAVTNRGTVTLTNGVLVDPLEGLVIESITWPDAAQPGRIGVGETVTGVARYALAQADVDRGFIENTASVSADTPLDGPVTDDSGTVVIPTVSAIPALEITKTGAASGDGALGDTVTWSIGIRSTGNVTVDGIELVDAVPGVTVGPISWPGSEGVLAPGETATATATSTITQADVDAGALTNIASATGTSVRDGAAVTSDQVSATVPSAPVEAVLGVTKTAELAPGAERAGDLVLFTYTITNGSTVTLSGVALADGQAGPSAIAYAWPGEPGVLAPGESVTATASYALTQADVDAGAQSSPVTATGTSARTGELTATAEDGVVIEPQASLAIAKSGAAQGEGAVGDRIDYAFSLENTGTVTLTLVELVDALFGVSNPVITWPGEEGILLPGGIATATADYTITQADVDRGSVSNTAIARGKPPVGDLIVVSSPESVTTVQPAAPLLTLEKTGTALGSGALGDLIDYELVLRNAGNVTVTDIAIVDALPGLAALSIDWPGLTGTLAPGQEAVATATYAITQADLDRGTVINSATAGGAFGGEPVTAASGEVSTPVAPAAPALVVTDSGALAPGATGRAGDIVIFTYTLANTGTVTLDGAALTEALVGAGPVSVEWPGEPGVLAPGQRATATAEYVLTQADVDAGSVVSIVAATATAPDGAVVDDTASTTVPISPVGVLETIKTGEYRSGVGLVGDVIEYRLEVTNRGSVTLTEGALVDPLEGLVTESITWPTPSEPGRIGVDETVTGVARYVLTQADVDRGFIENTASVSARTPAGALVADDSNTVIIRTAEPAPSLTTTKSAVIDGAGALGDVITYTITAENSGTVTLSGVALADPLPGLGSLAYGDWPQAEGVLAPGESITATAEYVITQADLDAGAVVNTASSTGAPPAGGEPVSDSSEPVTTPTEPASPSVAVSVDGALAPGSTGVAGDQIVWQYTLTNTGNVTLTASELVDALPGVSLPVYVWPGTPGVLLPGQSVLASATSTLAQSDVDAGAVVSMLTGSGLPPAGAAATASDTAVVLVASAPGLTLSKSAALAVDGANGLRDIIEYTFVVGNTGNVTLDAVAIADGLRGLSALVFDWPAAEGVLAPGAEVIATATYAITQEDIDRGSVDNAAQASATTPDGVEQLASSALTTVPTVDQFPSIATVKSGTVAGAGGVGDVIIYTFDITNTGNVTLSLIALRDELRGISTPDIEFPSATGILAPGASALGEATYTITQEDVDRGGVSNVATSVGTSPRGVVVSGVSNVFVAETAQAAASITTTHTAALAEGDAGLVGDSIEYVFTVRNNGNTTLDGVSLTNTIDGLGPLVYTWPTATAGLLAPGQSATATATRLVTQQDVDRGFVDNVTTATGLDPADATVTDDSDPTRVVLVRALALLDIVKTGIRVGDAGVGDRIDYSFTVTNTGETTFTDVTISDPLIGLSPIAVGPWPGAEGVLAPGDSVTASASYLVTQADLDAGAVRNTAIANGTLPDGSTTAAASDESVVPTAAQAPQISVGKTMALEAGATGRVGDRVEYAFTVTNTGTVTLRGVELIDAQPGLSPLVYTWPAGEFELAPGQSATATAFYQLTQADVDAGLLSSTVTATATSPLAVTVTDDAAAQVEIVAAPALTLEKTAELRTVAQQGAIVDFGFRVVNTGTVTLQGVEIVDALAGLGPIEAQWPGEVGVLAPGEVLTATAAYAITQADVDAGAVANAATVSGLGPDGVTTAGAADAAALPVPSEARIAIDATVALSPGQLGYAGDTLVYTYVVTNTGTTTLTGVRVVDGRPGLSTIVYGPWPGEPGVLLPGQSVTATATYVITPADEGRTLPSTATATGESAGDGATVTAVDEVAIDLPDRAAAPIPMLPQLPYTGAEVGLLGSSALLLLLGGLALALLSRQNNRKENA